jgi:hypothetical protein
MDKVKEILAAMKKHHFWILTGVLTLLSALGYMLARSSLSETISTRISSLDQKYTLVNTLNTAASTHPNSISNKQMDGIIGKLSEDVRDAWDKQYKNQEEIFVWPQEALLPDALEKVKDFRPIELALEYPMPPEKDPLDVSDREVYRDYIQRVFPNLASVIGAKWKAQLSGVKASGGYAGMPGSGGGPPAGGGNSFYGGQGGPGAAAIPVTDSLVVWDESAQQELLNSICYWYDPKFPPSTLQICYTQEDLWVLRGILDIIAKTNKGARENFQAAIKEIEFIRIGSSAMGRAGEITGGASTSASAYGSMMPGMNAGAGGASSMPAGYNAMGGGASTAVRKGPTRDPADMRYVDAKFNPVTGKDLRNKMKLNNPEDAFFAVAKRIPVRIRFKKMDQRKINDLLTECGNAKMVLEVRQVRISTSPAPGPGGGGAGAASGPGSDKPTLGGGGGAGAEGAEDFGSGGAGGGTTDAGVSAGNTFDLPVEIYGMIYLYNPVDMAKLGLQKVKTDTIMVTTVEEPKAPDAAAAAGTNATGTQPSATPPAAGTPQPNGAQPAGPNGTPVPPGTTAPADSAPPATNPPGATTPPSTTLPNNTTGSDVPNNPGSTTPPNPTPPGQPQ